MSREKPVPPKPKHTLLGLSFWVGLGLLLVTAGILACVPLFNLLGYEFCAAISLMLSITAGPVAIGAARRRAAILSGDASPQWVVARVYLHGLILNLATLVLPLAVILLNALRVKNCNPGVGFLFFLLLPVATAIICSAWGTAVGFLVRKRFLGGLTYAVLWGAVFLYNLWEFWAGPQMDSYNQIIGWFAGPIFDEVVQPDGTLLLSRIHGLMWAGLLLSVVAGCFDTRQNRLRSGVAVGNPRLLAPAGFFALAALTLFFCGTLLGYARSDGAVESELCGTTQTEHFVIHHNPDLPPEKADLLARDHEFRLHQIEKMLGPLNLPAIHSYVFKGGRQKKLLTGAGRTQFAKPWKYSMYLNGSTFPHGILKHELVHVVGAAFGTWPSRASARWVLWENVGLIEGLAVAVDWPARKFSPHTWSATLRRIGKAPDLRSLFGPVGFWTQPAGRTYILAGSFVRFLLDQYGPEPFRQAYRQGSLENLYPRSPKELIGDWESYLDGLELPPGVLETAGEKFSSPSIFKRTCAHEIAALSAQAWTHLARERVQPAAEAVENILAHLPGDPDALTLLAEIRAKEQKNEEAIGILEKLLQRDDLQSARKNRLQGRLGDLLVRGDRPEEARSRYLSLLQAHLNDGTDRLVIAKLESLQMGAAGRKVLEFLETGKLNLSTILDLREAAETHPHWGLAWYLVGRQLFNRELFEAALVYLKRAAATGLLRPELAAKNLRMLAVAYFRTENLFKAASILSVLILYPRHEGELLWALDWIERIGFELTHRCD
jgi:tetratricopeptide (TPR) repeat protein